MISVLDKYNNYIIMNNSPCIRVLGESACFKSPTFRTARTQVFRNLNIYKAEQEPGNDRGVPLNYIVICSLGHINHVQCEVADV